MEHRFSHHTPIAGGIGALDDPTGSKLTPFHVTRWRHSHNRLALKHFACSEHSIPKNKMDRFWVIVLVNNIIFNTFLFTIPSQKPNERYTWGGGGVLDKHNTIRLFEKNVNVQYPPKQKCKRNENGRR